MLDTAVVMMQQYSAAAALSLQVPQNGGAEATVPSQPSNANSSEANGNVSSETVHPNDSTVSNSTVKQTESNASTLSGCSSTDGNAAAAAAASQDQELRRRRLQKFEQAQEQ